jgi:DNA-binding transcriptional ArsR family regulator
MTGVKCMAVLKALGEMNRLRIMRLLLLHHCACIL